MMINNIFSFLSSLGYSTSSRSIHFHISDLNLNQQIDLQRCEILHEINHGLSVEAICISTNPYIELKQFIGCNVAIDQVTDVGLFHRTSGIVIGASAGQSDGGLCAYRLEIADGMHLLKKRINSRVFMNKNIISIVEIIFKEWREKSRLFSSSLKLDTHYIDPCNYPIRPFVMQFCESDYQFLSRLLREEGINFLITEEQYILQDSLNNIDAQKFILIDNNNQFQKLNRASIHYHRSNATERYDTITSFIAKRNLSITSSCVQRWQYKQYSHESGAGSITSSHRNSQQYSNEQIGIEQSLVVTPAWVGDFKGVDDVTQLTDAHINRLNKQLLDLENLEAKKFTALGHVRDAQVGYYFEFNEHPEIEKQHQHDKSFLILSKRAYSQNNFPKEVSLEFDQLLKLNHWDKKYESVDERQACELVLVRKDIRIVPYYDPLNEKPISRMMRAKVVGPKGEVIHTDEDGRVKVQFLFSREQDNAHDYGAGSNGIDTDSAWLETMTPWAYADGGGVSFIPRVGEEVFVDFVHGDIDRPFILGRLHESKQKPVQFDKKGQLPSTKSLSGIRSNEISGEGYGQLRFDDTKGQISTQLQSSHGITQLNLGSLSQPKESETSDSRGEGFELRTDYAGALRAAQGILISTEKDKEAESIHFLRTKFQDNIKFHNKNNQYFKKVADAHKVDTPDLDAQNKLQEKFENWHESHDAMIGMHSESDLIIDSKAPIHIQSKQNIDMSTPNKLQFFIGNSWLAKALNRISLFAKHAGIEITAGEGNVDLQAQKGQMTIASKEKMHMYALNDFVRIESPKGILLTSGEAYIKIQNGSIELGGPATLVTKFSQTQVKGCSTLSSELVNMPELNAEYSEHFILHYEDDAPAKNVKYKITTDNGKVYQGRTDDNGKTGVVNELTMTGLKIEILKE